MGRNWQSIVHQSNGGIESPDFLAAMEGLEADVTSGTGGSVPSGGTAGQVLEKASNADRDVEWATPLAAADAATIAGAWDFTTTPTVNGVDVATQNDVGAGILDAYPVLVRKNSVSGDIFASAYTGGGDSSLNGQGHASPFRVLNSGSFFVGVRVATAGSTGALIRLGIYIDDTTHADRPGALVADLGTIDGTVVGYAYAATSVALAAGTRYWLMVVEQGGATTHPFVMVVSYPTLTVGMQGNGNPGTEFFYSGISGALSSNPVVTAVGSANPVVGLFKTV